ncbi:MAG: ModD protein [Kiritimatiellales bacterium]
MIYFSDSEIDALIQDDLPVLDLTSHLLNVGTRPGTIRLVTRQKTVICCTEEAARIFQKLGLTISQMLPSGSRVEENTVILEAAGPAESLHAAWRCATNLVEHASGVATRTRRMVDAVHRVNPDIAVVTTRKIIPGAKKLMIKSILAGGAMPHRLGLSETVLIFDEHLRFIGGADALTAQMEQLKTRLGEKKAVVEAHTVESALNFAKAGADAVQLDKFSLEETRQVTETVKSTYPGTKVAIAGGVNLDNCAEYAAAGVDMIVTSALYFGKPADIKADLQPTA